MVDFKEKVQSFFFMKNTDPAHCCTLCAHVPRTSNFFFFYLSARNKGVIYTLLERPLEANCDLWNCSSVTSVCIQITR